MSNLTSFALFCQTFDPENAVPSNLQASSTTTTPSTGFPLFPNLPAELQLKIWRLSIPKRVLQLGTDIPYPFLRRPGPSTTQSSLFIDTDTTESALFPIPVSQPAIFHACHDSRAVCLQEYIPFGYSYMHPTLDTLYVSRLANITLRANLGKIHGGARPPLYPIALLDRVAMEFDNSDLPPRDTWDSRLWAPLLGNVLHAFEWFGVPRELLLVQATNTETVTVPAHLLEARKSYTNLEIMDIDLTNLGPAGELDELMGFVKKSLQLPCGPWLNRRIPEVKCVEMKRDEIMEMKHRTLKKFLPIGDRIAAKWRREVFELNRMHWDWGVHGNPYFPKNMERALAKYKENLKGKAS